MPNAERLLAARGSPLVLSATHHEQGIEALKRLKEAGVDMGSMMDGCVRVRVCVRVFMTCVRAARRWS